MFSSLGSKIRCVLVLSVWILTALSAGATEERNQTDPGITVLGRGPVHEAYARPTTLPYEPPPVVDRKPPEPIPEEPPDQKPEGDKVQWVPGYWSWDVMGKDWIWVSGLWRTPPPSRKWVPGHWSNTEKGWQWAPGFWANADSPNINYLEQPPASLDQGPSSPQPDDGSTYVPGQWMPRQSNYVWRPGYWLDSREGWIWNPGHYVWSPTGTIYVDGYWDYPLEDRGVLFAPVAFTSNLWSNPSWCFRPSWVVNCNGLFPSLFINPSWCNYCFGNFFSPACLRAGFQPWCTFGNRCWDPLFGHARWANRGNPNWSASLNAHVLAVRNGEAAAPPNTIVTRTGSGVGAGGRPLVTSLAQANSNGLKLANVSSAQLAQQKNIIKQTRDLSSQRTKGETSGLANAKLGTSSSSMKLPWAKSSLAPIGSSSSSAAGNLSNPSPGVHVLQSGTGNINRMQTIVNGSGGLPTITGSSPRSLSTGSNQSSPQIINSVPKAFSPSNASPAIHSTPPIRPSAPTNGKLSYFSAPRTSYASPSSGSRMYHTASPTFSGGSGRHYGSGGATMHYSGGGGGKSGGGHHK